MIPVMQARLPYLLKEVRNGRIDWYVRRGKGPRQRIKGAYGSAEFIRAYNVAIETTAPVSGSRKAGNGTLAHAVHLYRQSSAWAALATATRCQRETILAQVVESAGDIPIAKITRKHIMDGRERRAATPGSAENFVVCMKGLFKWCVEFELVTSNPTENVKAPKRAKDAGFKPWTEDEIAAFRAHWPIGTRERVAFDLLLYTGLRRGDVLVVGRQHVREGVIRLSTEKTGTRAIIPIDPELAATLAAGPSGDLAFITGDSGRAFKRKEAFGNWFRGVCRAAGVNKSPHGLRKAGANVDAESGYSESELEAKYAWTGGRMASYYTRDMNREKLAIRAAERTRKLER